MSVILWTAQWPNPYLEHILQLPPPHPYPLKEVMFVAALVTLQTGLLFAILRPHTYRHSWGRALVAVTASSAFFVYAALGAMHAPPFYFFYLWWLLLVAAAMLALVVVSGVSKMRLRNVTS